MIHYIAEYVALATQLLIFGTVLYNIKVSRTAIIKVDHITLKVEEVHKATNGLTARLEEASKREGIALGTAIGIQQEKDASKD